MTTNASFEQTVTGERFTDLSGKEFEDCLFENCDFKSATLSGARFVGCTFRSCDFSNSNLSGARFRDPVFRECKLLGVQWVQANDLVSPAFHDSHMAYGNFTGLKLKKSVFAKCNLRDVDFAQAEISESDFRGSDLLNARFHASGLVKADLRGAINYLIDPISNRVKGMKVSLPEAQGLLHGMGVVLE